MRPVRIEVEGFAAFRERAVVDLADTDLFALVGPTGAGKSTVIDAMVFALYGSVPRYGSKGLVYPVITQGALEAKVRVDFTVGDVVVHRHPRRAPDEDGRLHQGSPPRTPPHRSRRRHGGPGRRRRRTHRRGGRAAGPRSRAVHQVRGPPAGGVRHPAPRHQGDPPGPVGQAARPRSLRAPRDQRARCSQGRQPAHRVPRRAAHPVGARHAGGSGRRCVARRRARSRRVRHRGRRPGARRHRRTDRRGRHRGVVRRSGDRGPRSRVCAGRRGRDRTAPPPMPQPAVRRGRGSRASNGRRGDRRGDRRVEHLPDGAALRAVSADRDRLVEVAGRVDKGAAMLAEVEAELDPRRRRRRTCRRRPRSGHRGARARPGRRRGSRSRPPPPRRRRLPGLREQDRVPSRGRRVGTGCGRS